MNNQLTILIIDRAAINRAIIKGIFENEYTVLGTDNIESAWNLFLDKNFIDILFVDIDFYRTEDVLFLKRLKADVRFRSLPVIVTTDQENQDWEMQALELGADDYIVKPYNPRILKRKVSNIIEKYIIPVEEIHRNLEEKNQYVATLNEVIPGGVVLFELKKQLEITYFNDNFARMLGYSKEEMTVLLREKPWSFIVEEDREYVLKSVPKMNEEKRKIRKDIRMHKRDGSIIWMGVFIQAYAEESGSNLYQGIFLDLTEEKKTQEQLMSTMEKLKYRAECDKLTGIYNRETFYQKTEEMIKSNPKVHFVVGQWNIDRFKVINELFGSKAGDQILKECANFLKDFVGADATFGRLEADHFVFCTKLTVIESKISEFENILVGRKPWNSQNYPIRAHVGLYQVEDSSLPVDLMCDRADLALKDIKNNYLKRWNYYNEDLKETILNEQELLNDVEKALREKEFVVYYQPITSVRTLKPVAAEALVRWVHPQRGLISPGSFLPVLEKNGMISKLDMYVCQEVCRYQKERRERGEESLPVSVNLSRMNFYNRDLNQDIEQIMQYYEVPAEDLKIEITESAYTDNPTEVLGHMENFQKKGIKVLMDDFGSGYSSLNMLKDFNVDVLKIDMKFMDNLETSERAANILYSIIQMAKSLKIEVVAEGVETGSQFEMLSSMGCDCIQGYYFSKPLNQEEFEKKLGDMRRTDNKEVLQVHKHQTILVVDDLEMNRISIGENLKDTYEIIEAGDGEEALEVLRKQFSNISLVISDIYMPKMNGLELLRKMSNNDFYKQIPVLMVTAFGESENEVEAMELGALDVITKPYDPEILKKRIENLLSLSKQTSMEREVKILRENATGRKEIQDVIENNMAGLTRMVFNKLAGFPVKEVLFMNDRYQQMHRIASTVEIKSIYSILGSVNPEDKRKVRRNLKKAIQNEKNMWQYCYRSKKSDGSICSILCVCRLEYTEEEIIVDLAELEMDEESNNTIHRKLETIIDELSQETGLTIWRYNIENDSIDYYGKDINGKMQHYFIENGAKSTIHGDNFKESETEKVKALFDRLEKGEQKVQDVFLMRPTDLRKRDAGFHHVRITYYVVDQGQERTAIGVAEDLDHELALMQKSFREQQYYEYFSRDACFFGEVDFTTNEFVFKEVREEEGYLYIPQKKNYEKFVEEWLVNSILEEEISYSAGFLNRQNILNYYDSGERTLQFEFRRPGGRGEQMEWFSSTLFLGLNQSNHHICGSWSIRSIQGEKNQMNQIIQMAEHDALTSLYNRVTFEKYVNTMYDGTHLGALIMIDVDNFKAINDNFGHAFGDSVLKAIAKLLQQTFRTDDIIGRLGGDEFVVFILNSKSKNAIIRRVQELCTKTYMNFKNRDEDIYVSCSAGIVFAPEFGKSFHVLYTKADEALYHSKKTGKNKLSVYKQETGKEGEEL